MSDSTTDTADASIEAVVSVTDPIERLRRLAGLEVELGELGERVRVAKREAILEIRRVDPLATWASIGEILGVTAQRAGDISREP